jgi:ABC-type lipoprotein release transport system permease subunit
VLRAAINPQIQRLRVFLRRSSLLGCLGSAAGYLIGNLLCLL